MFYGRDPLTQNTVYVGPDSHFYMVHHSGTIGRNDLKSPWTPRNVSKL